MSVVPRAIVGGFRQSALLFFLPLLLLPLTGCLEPDDRVDPAVYQSDEVKDTLKRLLFPSVYWREKLAAQDQRVQAKQVKFREKYLRYRDYLQVKRKAVLEVTRRAREQKGIDLRKERYRITQEHREKLSQLRSESRAAYQLVKREMKIREGILDALERANR